MDEAKELSGHGVTYAAPQIDIGKLRAFKQGVVKKLTAGTYTLTFEASDTSSASLMPEFMGTAPSDFTIADGQTLTQDTVFLLSSM